MEKACPQTVAQSYYGETLVMFVQLGIHSHSISSLDPENVVGKCSRNHSAQETFYDM